MTALLRCGQRANQIDVVGPYQSVESLWHLGKFLRCVQPGKHSGGQALYLADEHDPRVVLAHAGEETIRPAPQEAGLFNRNDDHAVVANAWDMAEPTRFEIPHATLLHGTRRPDVCGGFQALEPTEHCGRAKKSDPRPRLRYLGVQLRDQWAGARRAAV